MRRVEARLRLSERFQNSGQRMTPGLILYSVERFNKSNSNQNWMRILSYCTNFTEKEKLKLGKVWEKYLRDRGSLRKLNFCLKKPIKRILRFTRIYRAKWPKTWATSPKCTQSSTWTIRKHFMRTSTDWSEGWTRQ